jgi:hypothetical protein
VKVYLIDVVLDVEVVGIRFAGSAMSGRWGLASYFYLKSDLTKRHFRFQT